MVDIFISVIINSYKRSEYIKEAVQSVLKQDFNKEMYEIIVVKGFKNREIDKFLQMNKVVSVYIDGKYNGERWAEGIRISRGNLICFMDDDDIFSGLKLKRVHSVYKDTLFNYYHNSYTFTLENLSKSFNDYLLLKTNQDSASLNRILKYNIKYKMNINSSSICVSRDVITNYFEESKKVSIGWDVYLFYLYLSNSRNFVIDNTYLTYYRRHNSYSYFSKEANQFKMMELNKAQDAENAYKLYLSTVPQEFLKQILKYEAFSYKIPFYICNSDNLESPKFLSIFSFLLNAKSYSLRFRSVYFLIGILSKLSKNRAFNLYFYLANRKIF